MTEKLWELVVTQGRIVEVELGARLRYLQAKIEELESRGKGI